MHDNRHSRRGGIVGPVILIGLGVVFLLNNLGVLDWSVWEILLRLWPVLLIAAGLDLILGRRSIWGSLLALVLTFGVLAAALWGSGAGVGATAGARGRQFAEPLGDVEQAELVIEPGVGTLRVSGGADSENLVQGVLRLGEGEEVEPSYSVRGDSGVFALRTERTSFCPFTTGSAGARLWDVQVTSRVPLDLETHLGVGQTDLNLAGLDLESLSVDHGIGQVVIRLPEDGQPEVKVDAAIGQTLVVVPRSLAARVRLDIGLTARRVPEDYDCDDNVCTSPGYRTADNRADLELGQAIGSVVIRH